MESSLEQRYALRFDFVASFNPTNAYKMLKNACLDSVIGHTAAYHWYSEFAVSRRVANITDISVEVRNLENDPYISRFLYGVSKFSDFLQILQLFDFFKHFLS